MNNGVPCPSQPYIALRGFSVDISYLVVFVFNELHVVVHALYSNRLVNIGSSVGCCCILHCLHVFFCTLLF